MFQEHFIEIQGRLIALESLTRSIFIDLAMNSPKPLEFVILIRQIMLRNLDPKAINLPPDAHEAELIRQATVKALSLAFDEAEKRVAQNLARSSS